MSLFLAAALLAAAPPVVTPSSAPPAAGQGAPAPSAPAAESVSRSTLQQTNKDRFAEMDADKDGFITAAELAPAVGAEQAARIVGGLDGNKDGKVSLAELDAVMLGMFDRADSNHDGIVTAGEQEALAASARPR